MPFHHKVNEGLVKCSDCHDVHGTFGNNNLRSTADQNMICTKCHTDMRGPFVYEHAAVKAEGCLACHTPHGSQNARLLNMPNINMLCNQCHSPVAAGTVHGMSAGSSEIACRAQLPHLHSWLEHERGVPQVDGDRAAPSGTIGRRGADPAADLAREFKVSMSATMFFQVRLHMKKIGWFSRLSNQQPSPAMIQRIAGGVGVAILLMTTGIAAAQNPAAATCRRRMRRCPSRRVFGPSERGPGRAHGRHHGQQGHVRHAGQYAVRAARAGRDL